MYASEHIRERAAAIIRLQLRIRCVCTVYVLRRAYAIVLMFMSIEHAYAFWYDDAKRHLVTRLPRGKNNLVKACAGESTHGNTSREFIIKRKKKLFSRDETLAKIGPRT